MGEGITITQCRAIACRCGATGEAAWAAHAVSESIRPTGLPLSVSAGFFFHESVSGRRIACVRCQQIVTPN